MKFKRCDRCNVEIEDKKGMAKALELLSEAAIKIAEQMKGKPVGYQLYRGEAPADLCPACQKSLQAWIKEGSKSQHQNEEQEPASDRNTKIVIAAIEDPTQPNPAGPKTVEFGKF